MTHVRKQIRVQIISEVTGLTLTGLRVHDTRFKPLNRSELPALIVDYDTGETEEAEHDGMERLIREVRIGVKAIARASNNVVDTLDEIAADVETAVTRTLGGLVVDCIPTATRFNTSGEGDAEIASCEVVFNVVYRTAFNLPEVAL